MNSTKLGAFCDKVLEIGWLLAVIITPLFFNVYSSRVFEPDKLTTLRTVALIMAAVWVVKYIEGQVSGRREVGVTWRTPLVFPTLFMIVVYLLSTILSFSTAGKCGITFCVDCDFCRYFIWFQRSSDEGYADRG